MSSRGRFFSAFEPLLRPPRRPSLPPTPPPRVPWRFLLAASASACPRRKPSAITPLPQQGALAPRPAPPATAARGGLSSVLSGPGGLRERCSQVLPVDVHRRFGEIVVGPRVSDPRASVSNQGKSRGFGLKLRERWAVCIHLQLQNCDHVFKKWPLR